LVEILRCAQDDSAGVGKQLGILMISMRFLRERRCEWRCTFTTFRNVHFEESSMRKHANRARLIVGAAVLVAALTVFGTAAAQKASAPKAQDRLTIGEQNVRQLLLLMDTDKNGMVSKAEYMRFMEAEFHRLDKGNSGALNARELNQSAISASRFTGK
jgi:hypothetical protein